MGKHQQSIDRRLSRVCDLLNVSKQYIKLRSWQVIKGFDKSEIHDVFSIYPYCDTACVLAG